MEKDSFDCVQTSIYYETQRMDKGLLVCSPCALVRLMQLRKEQNNLAVSNWFQGGIAGSRQGWTNQETMKHQLSLCSESLLIEYTANLRDQLPQ